VSDLFNVHTGQGYYLRDVDQEEGMKRDLQATKHASALAGKVFDGDGLLEIGTGSTTTRRVCFGFARNSWKGYTHTHTPGLRAWPT